MVRFDDARIDVLEDAEVSNSGEAPADPGI